MISKLIIALTTILLASCSINDSDYHILSVSVPGTQMKVSSFVEKLSSTDFEVDFLNKYKQDRPVENETSGKWWISDAENWFGDQQMKLEYRFYPGSEFILNISDVESYYENNITEMYSLLMGDTES